LGPDVKEHSKKASLDIDIRSLLVAFDTTGRGLAPSRHVTSW